MDRFHIVVFNYERIESFLNNFDKIENFKPDRDRVLVIDCSVNHEAQREAAIKFAQERGWAPGTQIQVIKRKNWGIDQGARIDYFTSLRRTGERPQYIWQFQEHYLDLKSPWSIWTEPSYSGGSKLKSDTIPDDIKLDLDLCAEIYRQDPAASVIYADREKIGVFTHDDGREWFYADGANFSVRTDHVLETFSDDLLQSYRAIYDGSYQWTLFMELDICRQLTRAGHDWHDLVSGEHFADTISLRNIESSKHVSLHQTPEAFYSSLYNRYETRLGSALSQSAMLRRLTAMRASWYVSLRQSNSMEKLKRSLKVVGLEAVGKRTLHYIAGVRSEDEKSKT